MMMRLALIIGLGAACGFLGRTHAVAADQAGTAPPSVKPAPCSAPEHRQFDFWIGDWEVRNPSGKIVGHNRIAAIQDGCALQENWTGSGNVTGTSLNCYDAERKQWHQTWVDSSGGLLKIDGGLVAGSMVLHGELPASNAAGGIALQRITWTPQPDGRVRQHWETSTDGGKTWSTAFDGMYSRRS
jgi:hypothetical protein